jgi:hypothetical protein
METLVRITPWIDPPDDRRGHDPRSTYVELFWLARADRAFDFALRW